MRARVVCILLCLVGCEPEKSEPSPKESPSPSPVVAPVAALAAVDAAPPPQPTIVVPKKKLPAKDVLGKTRTQVAQLLGKGHKIDPGLMYDGFDGTAVRVEYEDGKAAMIDVTVAEYSNTTANNEAIVHWAGLEMSDPWFVSTGGVSIEIWDPDARYRAMQRKDIGRKVGEFLKERDAGAAHSRGEVETSLLVRPRYGMTCSRADLASVRNAISDELDIDLKGAGFLTMTCDLDGAAIKL